MDYKIIYEGPRREKELSTKLHEGLRRATKEDTKAEKISSRGESARSRPNLPSSRLGYSPPRELQGIFAWMHRIFS